jgi:hypothetical protein
MNTINDYMDNKSNRVPITFRLSVKKKQELMLCAAKCGGTLTDVLEVITDEVELKFKHRTSELLIENKRLEAQVSEKNDELDNANKLIAKLKRDTSDDLDLLRIKTRKIFNLINEKIQLKKMLSEKESNTSF